MADEDGLATPFDDYLFGENQYQCTCNNLGIGPNHTFLPSGMAAKSISTFACASTSAEADMLTRKSAFRQACQPLCRPDFPLHHTMSLDTPFNSIANIYLAQ